MKGQRLFVRPATPADTSGLAMFFEAEGRPLPPERLVGDALIGFLVGDIVARAAFELTPGGLRITDFWVARNLRRKRIARVMIGELADLARKLGSRDVTVRSHPDLDEPFRRLGFLPAGEHLIRTVE